MARLTGKNIKTECSFYHICIGTYMHIYVKHAYIFYISIMDTNI